MKPLLDWSFYRDAGMGDAYADIPKQGGDFAKAVAVCIGSKQCQRETDKGVMCPSFRASGDPVLSPGGRVKLLKAALNAQDADALFEPAIADAMDLCVGCKGCRRECENEVDMAVIKAEFLAQRNARFGLPLRRRLWGELPRLLNLPGIRALIGFRNAHGWLARLGERVLGIHARSPLPLPAERPFAVAGRCRETTAASGERRVVLLVDTFNLHFNPAVADAALRLLSAAGYEVQVAAPTADDREQRPLCCGRTYFSNGMFDQARREARRMLNALQPALDSGLTVVGLEPSCILSLRDEYLKLELGDTAKLLAGKALLLEEFIVREQTAKRWTLEFAAVPELPRVLLHGHCHQKAVGAIKSVRKVLKQVPGLSFELIEASCCGMAGNFGLEAEHHHHAQAMAELALFPALRAEPEVPVVGNGFSCQQQIANAGFGKPMHLAELLVKALPAE